MSIVCLFSVKIERLQYIMLYYTVPSIVKKDIKPPDLHYGWHLQIKLISMQNKKQNHKTKSQYAQTTTKQLNQADYWSRKLELFNS